MYRDSKYTSEASTKTTRYHGIHSRKSAHKNIRVRLGIAQANTVVRPQRNWRWIPRDKYMNCDTDLVSKEINSHWQKKCLRNCSSAKKNPKCKVACVVEVNCRV